MEEDKVFFIDDDFSQRPSLPQRDSSDLSLVLQSDGPQLDETANPASSQCHSPGEWQREVVGETPHIDGPSQLDVAEANTIQQQQQQLHPSNEADTKKSSDNPAAEPAAFWSDKGQQMASSIHAPPIGNTTVPNCSPPNQVDSEQTESKLADTTIDMERVQRQHTLNLIPGGKHKPTDSPPCEVFNNHGYTFSYQQSSNASDPETSSNQTCDNSCPKSPAAGVRHPILEARSRPFIPNLLHRSPEVPFPTQLNNPTWTQFITDSPATKRSHLNQPISMIQDVAIPNGIQGDLHESSFISRVSIDPTHNNNSPNPTGNNFRQGIEKGSPLSKTLSLGDAPNVTAEDNIRLEKSRNIANMFLLRERTNSMDSLPRVPASYTRCDASTNLSAINLICHTPDRSPRIMKNSAFSFLVNRTQLFSRDGERSVGVSRAFGETNMAFDMGEGCQRDGRYNSVDKRPDPGKGRKAAVSRMQSAVSSVSSFSRVSSVEDRACRICWVSDEREDVIQPCHCTGSAANIHPSCLQKWLQITSVYHCEVCRFKYHTRRHTKPLSQWKWRIGKNRQVSQLEATLILLAIVTPPLMCGIVLSAQKVMEYIHNPDNAWKTAALMTLVLASTFTYMAALIYFCGKFSAVCKTWVAINQTTVVRFADMERTLEFKLPSRTPSNRSRASHDSLQSAAAPPPIEQVWTIS